MNFLGVLLAIMIMAMEQVSWAQCRIEYDVRVGPLVGCWNTFEEDHSFELIPELYRSERHDDYMAAVGRCRQLPSIRRAYCDFSGLELLIDELIAAYARSRRDRGIYWRLSAVRYSYLAYRSRNVIGIQDLEYLLAAQQQREFGGRSWEEFQICGRERELGSSEMRTAILAIEDLRRQRGMSSGTRLSAQEALELLRDPSGPESHCSPVSRRGMTCYLREDLVSMYEFALPYWESVSGQIPARALTMRDLTQLCRNFGRTRTEALRQTRDRVDEYKIRSARAERLLLYILNQFADSEGFSGQPGFLIMSQTVPLEGFTADGKKGPTLASSTLASIQACRGMGSIPQEATGQEWIRRYYQAVKQFRNEWEGCMRSQLGSSADDSSDSSRGSGGRSESSSGAAPARD